MKLIHWIGLSLVLSIQAQAQFAVQGSVDSQWRRYQAWGQESRIPPNAYFLSGKMVWQWADKIKIPVTFSLTNQRVIVGVPSLQVPKRWAQSFNRLSFQPKWKDHQFYVGTHALTFSPYTLAGHRAQGLGYVYRSSKSPIYGGIQGGQLLQRVLPDSGGVSRPAYARWGGSAKLGYQHKQGFVEVSHLGSTDVWRGEIWDRFIPEQNQASSVSVQQKITEFWRLNTVYGRSVISRFEGEEWQKQKVRQAWKLEALYQTGAWEGGMAYAHTDPQFRTHGAYMINQDLNLYSGHGHWQQDWGGIRGEMGVEQSTRQSQRLSRETRWVHRWQAQGQWESGWSIEIIWSNFTSIANLRPELLYLQALESWNFVDTLNFRQVNQQWTSQVGYQVPTGSKDLSTALSYQGQWQQGRDSQGEQQQITRIFSNQVSFSRTNTKRKSSFQASIQAIQTTLGERSEWMMGPQVHWKKTLGNRDSWELMGQLAQNQFWSTGHSTRHLWTGLLSCTAKVGNQHRLSLQSRWMHQKGLEWGQLTEQTVTLSYQYQWSLTLFPPKP